jgi:hypothetical protein
MKMHSPMWMPCPIFRVRRYAIAALVEFCTPAAVRRVAHGRRWRWLLQRSSSFLGQKAENWLSEKGSSSLTNQRAAVRKAGVDLSSLGCNFPGYCTLCRCFVFYRDLECHHLQVSAFSNGPHHASELEGRNEGMFERRYPVSS